MATVTTLANPLSANLPPRVMDNSNFAYKISKEIDLAAAVTAKGSALAAADVIEVLRLPAGVVVLAAGARKTAAMTGTSTDLTFDVGITGGDVDQFVDGWDYDAAAVGAIVSNGVQMPPAVIQTSDTIDILIATQTGTLTGGKVEVWAVIVDVLPESRGAIAQPKS